MNDPDIVKEARTKLGLTQADFGALIGVSNRTVIRWEQGENKLGPGLPLLIERLVERHARTTARKKQVEPSPCERRNQAGAIGALEQMFGAE
jgi:transcriptional regulator with XRE-family HTH domain